MTSSDPQTSRTSRREPGERMIYVGAMLFAVGLAAGVLVLVPLFFGGDAMPTSAYVVSMLMPVGIGLALAGLLRGVRARGRATRRR